MTVSNGVDITESDLINHLVFKASGDLSIPVVEKDGFLIMSDGTDDYNRITLNEGVITFNGAPGGPNLVSYSWE